MENFPLAQGVPIGSSPFQYQPLEKETMIRLVKVHPARNKRLIDVELFHVDFPQPVNNPPKYKCLSYAWGAPPETHEILLNGNLIRVRQNLFKFLELAAEAYPNEPLWIDALCISQEDVVEKSHQVQRMGSIYTYAAEVLVWLGNGLRIEHTAAWVRLGPGSRLQLIDKASTKRERELKEICRNAYWSRAWIAQEILLQSNIKLLAGHESIDWMDFVFALKEREGQEGPDWVRASPAFSLTETWDRRHNIEEIEPEISTYNFWQLLRLRSTAQCVDIRDRIYSLLALVDNSNRSDALTVDYSENITNLFWRVGNYYDAWSSVERMAVMMRALELSTSQLEEALTTSPGDKISVSIDQALSVPQIKSILEQMYSSEEDWHPDQMVIIPVAYIIDHMRCNSVDAWKWLL